MHKSPPLWTSYPSGHPGALLIPCSLQYVHTIDIIYITDRASLVAQLVKNLPAMQESRFSSWVRKACWRRDRLPTLVFLGFPGGSDSKESACNA